MNSKKKKDMKLIKKRKIWPSIMLFILSLLISFVIVMAFTGIFGLYLLQNKIEDANANYAALYNNISTSYYDNNDIKTACMMGIRKDKKNTTFAIIDKNNQYVCGNGENTYSISECAEYHNINDETRYIYLDTIDRSEWINENFDIPLKEVLKLLKQSTHNEDGELNSSNITLWVAHDIENTDYTILTKAYIKITRGDIMVVVVMLSLAFIAILIPFILMFINIIRLIKAQHRSTRLIYYDQVTGGENWLYFKHKATKTLSQRKNFKNNFIIADLMFNKFRNFCSCRGVKEGEALLKQIDDIIISVLSKNDLVAHYANANFCLMLKCTSLEEGKEKVAKIHEELSNRLEIDKITFHTGIYYLDNSSADSHQNAGREADISFIYNNAGIARGSSKKKDENDIVVFDQSMLDNTLWEHKVEATMEQALINEEFAVYLQPKYNPTTNELMGAEALVRWISPTEGFISPGKFIPLFEKNGFITKLDDYMISHVAKLQADWISEGKHVVPISVNISRAHFANPDLADHICKLVDKYNVPHDIIEIELTESAFFDDKTVLLNTVNKLKEYNFEISMDDFGAGYSSLNSLKDLPLDVLKLDAEFFRGDFDNKRGEIVVEKAISLAKSLNMRIVAEGIEKKEQVDFLAAQNCDMIQGFYFAKPMPINEYIEKAFPQG